MAQAKQYKVRQRVMVSEYPPSHPSFNKSPIWVERADFCCASNDNEPPAPDGGATTAKPSRKKRRNDDQPYLIIGFDTEYKTPGVEMSNAEIREGKAKVRVLSYQFHCETSEGFKWSGIWCPDEGQRITLGEFLIFALGKGRREGHAPFLHRKIILVGHFTRADIPAFADFQDVADFIGSVRSTFISLDRYIPVEIKFLEEVITLRVTLRDTMLLSPAQSKSLAALGELVGIPKILLSDDPKQEVFLKQNMDALRDGDWELFRRYALILQI